MDGGSIGEEKLFMRRADLDMQEAYSKTNESRMLSQRQSTTGRIESSQRKKHLKTPSSVEQPRIQAHEIPPSVRASAASCVVSDMYIHSTCVVFHAHVSMYAYAFVHSFHPVRPAARMVRMLLIDAPPVINTCPAHHIVCSQADALTCRICGEHIQAQTACSFLVHKRHMCLT